MSKLYAMWIKKRSRFFRWYECSYCGYKSLSTIWNDDVIYRKCPNCFFEMENGVQPPKTVYDISKLPPIGKCLKDENAFQDNRCLHCGWNETEYRRRLQCPLVLKDGLWHLNIAKK